MSFYDGNRTVGCKTIEQVRETKDIDAKLIHAVSLLEYLLTTHFRDGDEDATVGQLLQRRESFLGVALIKKVNEGLRCRNIIAHASDRAAPTQWDKERGAENLLVAIEKHVNQLKPSTAEEIRGKPSHQQRETTKSAPIPPSASAVHPPTTHDAEPTETEGWQTNQALGVLAFPVSVALGLFLGAASESTLDRFFVAIVLLISWLLATVLIYTRSYINCFIQVTAISIAATVALGGQPIPSANYDLIVFFVTVGLAPVFCLVPVSRKALRWSRRLGLMCLAILLSSVFIAGTAVAAHVHLK